EPAVGSTPPWAGMTPAPGERKNAKREMSRTTFRSQVPLRGIDGRRRDPTSSSHIFAPGLGVAVGVGELLSVGAAVAGATETVGGGLEVAIGVGTDTVGSGSAELGAGAGLAASDGTGPAPIRAVPAP